MIELKRGKEFEKIVPAISIFFMPQDKVIAQTSQQPVTQPYVPPQPDHTTSFGIIVSLVVSVGSLIYIAAKGYIEKISQRSAIELKREEMESASNHSMIGSIIDQQKLFVANSLQSQRQDREDMVDAIRANTEAMNKFIEQEREAVLSNAKILIAIEQLSHQIESLKQELQK
jgi:hypothetical protein